MKFWEALDGGQSDFNILRKRVPLTVLPPNMTYAYILPYCALAIAASTSDYHTKIHNSITP